MNETLKDKTFLITGATRGIGFSIAKTLHQEGATVVLSGRNKERLDSIVQELNSDRCHAIESDLKTEDGCLKLKEHFFELNLSLHGLINNAGIGIFGLAEETTTETWDSVMAVNARAPFLLSREFIPIIRSTGGGHIINMASVVAHKGYPNQSAYAASKHALLGFSKSLARELQPDNIRVHVLCPGGVDTDMVSDSRPDLDRSVLMSPEEISETVLFLLTRKGNGVIDQIDLRRETSTPWA